MKSIDEETAAGHHQVMTSERHSAAPSETGHSLAVLYQRSSIWTTTTRAPIPSVSKRSAASLAKNNSPEQVRRIVRSAHGRRPCQPELLSEISRYQWPFSRGYGDIAEETRSANIALR